MFSCSQAVFSLIWAVIDYDTEYKVLILYILIKYKAGRIFSYLNSNFCYIDLDNNNIIID